MSDPDPVGGAQTEADVFVAGLLDSPPEGPPPPEGPVIPADELAEYVEYVLLDDPALAAETAEALGRRFRAGRPVPSMSPLGTFGFHELMLWQEARKIEAQLLGAPNVLSGTSTGPVIHERSIGPRWPLAALDLAGEVLEAEGLVVPPGWTLVMTRQHRSALDAFAADGEFRPDPRWGVPMFDERYQFAELAHAVRHRRNWWERLVWCWSDAVGAAAAAAAANVPGLFGLTGLLHSADDILIFAAVPAGVAVHVPFLVWDSGVLRGLPYRPDPFDALARGEDRPAAPGLAGYAGSWAPAFTLDHDPAVVRHQTLVSRILLEEVRLIVTYDDVGPGGLAVASSDDEFAPRLLEQPRNYPEPGPRPLA